MKASDERKSGNNDIPVVPLYDKYCFGKTRKYYSI